MVINLLQCIKQAQWPDVSPVLTLPGILRPDGTQHEYAKRSMAELLSIPRAKIDKRLPKEVLS
jgi:hypothetical protein